MQYHIYSLGYRILMGSGFWLLDSSVGDHSSKEALKNISHYMCNKPEPWIGYRYFLGFMILFVIIHFYHWGAGF